MKKIKFYRVFAVILLLLLLPFIGFTASAQDAEEYAPILYFEGEETCYPVNVEYFLANVIEHNITITLNDEDTVVPYYDNTLGTISDEGIISDYQNKYKNNDPSVYPTVYYHVSSDSGSIFIQYWMFYAFNPGEHNQHEGDWEMVQVVIPSSGEKWVAYSQHYSGQKAAWNLVEKDGDNIKVYVSRGSHANYLRSYSGKLGIASDIVGDNGEILKPSDYDLVELDNQTWLEFEGLWGEVNSVEDFFRGQAGPQGPKYRTDMTGNTKMWDGLSWGSGLMEANDTFFTIEWFLYNFIMIFILVSAVILAVTGFRIYLRHKKHGLGPRFVSMLYIDGPNLHTIGNILCFVGIIIAIIGLFGTWYTVTADINIDMYPTSGATDIITLDGMNGMQVFMPSQYGPVPMGSVVFPFALVMLIGFIFLVIATIGIHKSGKLGLKYIFRGIRVILIIIIILVALMLMGNFTGMVSGGGSSGDDNFILGLINEISSNPAGGTYNAQDFIPELTGDITFQWGLGQGAIYLLIAGIVLIVSGALEIAAKKEFFQPKTPYKKDKKQKKTEPVKEPVEEKPFQKEDAENLCPKCGNKLKKGAKFCTKCGNKL